MFLLQLKVQLTKHCTILFQKWALSLQNIDIQIHNFKILTFVAAVKFRRSLFSDKFLSQIKRVRLNVSS